MLAISRFRVCESAQSEFEHQAAAAVERFRASTGNRSARLVRNLDDPELWAIITDWENVGDYRRSFSGYEAKLVLLPLLSRAIDEPGAYAAPAELGSNIPREG